MDSKRALQKDMTVAYKLTWSEARGDTTDLTRTCRAVLTGNPDALRTLGLAGKSVPANLNDFLRFTDSFIAVLETGPQELRDTLAGFGVNAARIAQLKGKVAALRAAESASDAAAMRLRKLARLALKDQPQLLEAMGIVV